MDRRNTRHQPNPPPTRSISDPAEVVPASAAIATSDFPLEMSLVAREAEVSARESGLVARRAELARELRRHRDETARFDGHFDEVKTLMAELACAVLESNRFAAARPPHSVIEESNDTTVEDLLVEVESLREELRSLKMQNEQLATDLGQSTVRRSIAKSRDADPTLTWEQRKALLFAQDSQIEDDQDDANDSRDDRSTIDQLLADLQARDSELGQLRDLLEQRPTQCEAGMAVGAAAIAQMLDADELIGEERTRLRELQTEWETKFRDIEISGSIERANLARERQLLQRRNVELEEQLAHLKRELKQEAITGPKESRRWLAKLGLAE